MTLSRVLTWYTINDWLTKRLILREKRRQIIFLNCALCYIYFERNSFLNVIFLANEHKSPREYKIHLIHSTGNLET